MTLFILIVGAHEDYEPRGVYASLEQAQTSWPKGVWEDLDENHWVNWLSVDVPSSDVASIYAVRSEDVFLTPLLLDR